MGIDILDGNILITGAAGFIGFHLCRSLLNDGAQIIGFDNLNDYYDVELKQSRLDILKGYEKFSFIKGDLADEVSVRAAFEKFTPQMVVNLAAQAGVRYSIENPQAYISSNVVGFLNILEACRSYPVRHLVYASSSSVYGNQQKVPFSVEDDVNRPVSLYAATKRTDELMAYTYSHLYNIHSTGLRFFTVYGPYGRPDMAYFAFAKKILNDEPIQIFNNGNMYRDFTYIDDIVDGVRKVMSKPPVGDCTGAPYALYNIGNNKPENLMYFVEVLEKHLGKQAEKILLPMQAGDVYQTYADISAIQRDFEFSPVTDIEEGLEKFVAWYLQYYGKPREEKHL